MNSISCDVVILPEPSLANKGVLASQMLERFGSYYTLKDGTCFPHVSLYMLELMTEDIPKVVELLNNIATAFSPFKLEAYRYNHTWGFIDAEYKSTTELDELQRQVVETFNPLRNGMREIDVERMQTATGTALENFQNYGYKYIGELFRPHMSLTRLKETNEAALEALEDMINFNGTFSRIGIFELGDHDTCIREIKSYYLL